MLLLRDGALVARDEPRAYPGAATRYRAARRLGRTHRGYEQGVTTEPGHDDDPHPEDPTRFPSEPGIEPLDEAPDGQTPSDTTDSDTSSLPPGAPRR